MTKKRNIYTDDVYVGLLLNPNDLDKPICIATKHGTTTLAARFSCDEAESFCDAMRIVIEDARLMMRTPNDTNH